MCVQLKTFRFQPAYKRVDFINAVNKWDLRAISIQQELGHILCYDVFNNLVLSHGRCNEPPSSKEWKKMFGAVSPLLIPVIQTLQLVSSRKSVINVQWRSTYRSRETWSLRCFFYTFLGLDLSGDVCTLQLSCEHSK